MGNATLYWDEIAVDLGARGLQGLGAGRALEGQRVLTPARETVLTRLADTMELEFGPLYIADPAGADAILYRALVPFAAWAQQGRPFGLALDSAAVVDTVLTADPNYVDKMAGHNGNLEAWNTAGTTPDGATISVAGTTAITRENKREDVRQGKFAVKWAVDGSANLGTLTMPTSDSIASGASVSLTFQAKRGAVSANLEYSIKNATSNNYLQAAGTWGAGVAWHAAGGGSLGVAWGKTTKTFNQDSSTGGLIVAWRNTAVASATLWLDDIRLWIVSGSLLVVSSSGIVANDYVRLLSRTQGHDEIVKVSSVPGSTEIVLTAVPSLQFIARDIVRSIDYWPALQVDSKEPVLREAEDGGSLMRLKLKCTEAELGRY